ncbi:hypothetical protein J6590_108204 [Homalodisca vitripennis]|nr:hypothetical protein J6590_108204 [Homalodisca vitripennis]
MMQGCTIDSQLTWKPHIDQLCKKLSSGTYFIRRIKQVSGQSMAKVAYFALLESHLRYGLAIWGGAGNTYKEKVLIHQKRALRCLAGLHFQESCRETFKQLKILTVVALYIREVIIHAVNTEQIRHQDLHQHSTCNASNFNLPSHKLSLYRKKPSYIGALYYNHLPEDLKREPPHRFKRSLTIYKTILQ